MNILVIFTSILFSLFSTAIMSYISMAAPIGPWVELIVVFLATMLFRVGFGYYTSERLKYAVGMTTAAAGIGGIVATACGFAFPTLYFLNTELFDAWLGSPLFFCGVMSGIVLVAGGFAFVVVYFLQDKMLADENMSFPIGQMVRKTIVAQNQLRKSIELFTGAVLTFIFSVAQRCVSCIPSSFVILPRLSYGFFQIPYVALRLDFLPMFIAIGYVAGHILMVPLSVGVAAKVFLISPIQRIFFADLKSYDFLLAFGSGMVLQGAVMSFVRFPRVISSTYRRIIEQKNKRFELNGIGSFAGLLSMAFCFCSMGAYFWYFNFSLLSQLYLFVFSAVCVYQVLLIGGRVGLAPFGRFATFVMVPGLLIFGYDSVQATLVSVFVGVAGGVAVDLMFGRKMAQSASINRRDVVLFQVLGLVVSSLAVGVIFWLLINHFGLGSDELIAQKALNRALLINVHTFNYAALLIGAFFGVVLRWLKMNVMLVFTGLLFPIDFSLMLILGGLLTSIQDNKEEWDPFWSGVFAAGSLWMVLKVFL